MNEPYEAHEAAAEFPMLDGDEYSDLVADIKANGQRIPISLCSRNGKWVILDGRNRYKACLELGIKPKHIVIDCNEDDAFEYVVSLNMHRRHLNTSQRAVIAHCLVERRTSGYGTKSRQLAEAAKAMKVGPRSIERAAHVRETVEPEVYEAVRKGDIKLNEAEELGKLTREQQLERVNGAKSQPKRAHPDVANGQTKATRLSDADAADLLMLCEGATRSGDVRLVNAATVIYRMVPWLRNA